MTDGLPALVEIVPRSGHDDPLGIIRQPPRITTCTILFTSGSAIPEVVQLIIKETIAKAVPLIFEKLTSGGALGGLPLEAILDWRKAVPNPAAGSSASAPAAATAPSTPTAPTAPAAPVAPVQAATGSAPSWPASTITELPSSPSRAPAGAAPSRESAPGAAPAEMPIAPASTSPRNQEDAAALLNAHVLQVWQRLSPQERTRATQLIARLTAEERTGWLAELARLTVPEATARARAFIHGPPPPTSPTPPPPTVTAQGETS